MSAHPVFCSHCGVANTVDSSPGFSFRCDACQGVTIGMKPGWISDHDGLSLPYPPVVSYEEKEYRCTSCESHLAIEIVLRSVGEPCESCCDLAVPELPAAGQTVLSEAELTFLSAS